MPKNPHADFTPTLAGYSGITPFRFWCQTALPLTYDDSLSYYELLNKVVNYLNHTIEDLTNVENNTSELAEAYDKLQKYVNDYFDDIDIEAELRNVLDGMAEDGTLDALLDPLVANRLPGVVEQQIDGAVAEQIGGVVAEQIDDTVAEQLPGTVSEQIPEEVTSWLDDNVTPVGSAVVVDNTLTITGAAGDAKVTGDRIGELNTNVDKNTVDIISIIGKEGTSITDISGYTRNTGSILQNGTWTNVTNEGYKHIVIPVEDDNSHLYIDAQIGTGFQVYFAGVKAYVEPVAGQSLILSDAEGWTSRKSVSSLQSNHTFDEDIPADVKYIVMVVLNNSVNCEPTEFNLSSPTIDGRLPVAEEKIEQIEEILPVLTEQVNENTENIISIIGQEGASVTDISGYTRYNGSILSTGVWDHIDSDNYKHIVIPVEDENSHLFIDAQVGTGLQVYFAGVKEYVEPVEDQSLILSDAEGWTSRKSIPSLQSNHTFDEDIPADVKYIVMVVLNKGVNCEPTEFNLSSEGITGRLEPLENEYNKSKVKFKYSEVERNGVMIPQITLTGRNYGVLFEKTATVQGYQWDIKKVYDKNGDNIMPQGADLIGVIRLIDENDFIGGIHGDENNTEFLMECAGVTVYDENTPNVINGVYENIHVVMISDLYNANNHETKEIERYVDFVFTSEGWTCRNTFKMLINAQVNVAYCSGLYSFFKADVDNVFTNVGNLDLTWSGETHPLENTELCECVINMPNKATINISSYTSENGFITWRADSSSFKIYFSNAYRKMVEIGDCISGKCEYKF